MALIDGCKKCIFTIKLKRKCIIRIDFFESLVFARKTAFVNNYCVVLPIVTKKKYNKIFLSTRGRAPFQTFPNK